MNEQGGIKLCQQCGATCSNDSAKFCSECGYTRDVSVLHPSRSSELAITMEVIESALASVESFEHEEAALALSSTYPRLSDADWDSLHLLLASWRDRMGENLVGAVNAVSALSKAAQVFDLDKHLGIKARALGLASSVPFPEWNGYGTWDEQSDAWFAEFELLDRVVEHDLPIQIADLAYLSDYARSAGGGDLFYESSLADNPLGLMRVETSSAGEVLQSMTAVSLLAASDAVGGATSQQINSSEVLINPRLIHLFCDDENVLEPWWTEMMPWESIIRLWKETNSEAFDPGLNDRFLSDQLRRSTTWELYADQRQAAYFRQDEELFLGLLRFMEKCQRR